MHSSFRYSFFREKNTSAGRSTPPFARQALAELTPRFLRRVVTIPQGPGLVGAETGGGRRDPADPLDGH